MTWLAMIGRLGSAADNEFDSAFLPQFCDVLDIGFCGGTREEIVVRPPRIVDVPYDAWCRENSLVIKCDNNLQATGSIELREAHVYDNRYRGEIDFTGISATISLRDEAYEAYVDYLGRAKVPERTDYASWDGYLRFCLPSPRFEFPKPRGSSRPWDCRNTVGKLHMIKRFEFDCIEVQQLEGRLTHSAGILAGLTAGRPLMKPSLHLGPQP